MMTFGSLFAGIGGFDLGLQRAGMQVAWQVEIDPFCRHVLAKHWPDVPRFEDVRHVGRNELGTVDLICGGWPCQPFSVAGKRRGKEDDRHLWPEVRRIIAECRPRWFLGENVPGIIGMELDQVLFDLEAEGYTAWPFVIPACGVDAPHRRSRVWIMAHAGSERLSQPEHEREHGRSIAECSWWESEPGVGRVANGLPGRVDRLKGLGNAVVPQVVEQIGRFIMEADNANAL